MDTEETFVGKHNAAWRRLEGFNAKLGKTKISKLSQAEIQEFAELYRTASHHLAYAKTYYEGGKTVLYLNQLLGLSHTLFYKRQKAVFHDIAHYFAAGFPSRIREKAWYLAAAFLAFFLGALLIVILSRIDNTYMFYFLPDGIVESNNISGQLSSNTWEYPILASYVMTNNIRVAALCIAFGVLLGLGTFYVLFSNGLMLGAFYAMTAVHNLDMTRFWSLILPHGVLELPAIFFAGAAGLIIGKGLLIPKDYPRSQAFVKGAKEAFYLLPGITLMLIIAGIIEGFFTPLNIPEATKLLFSLALFILLVLYILLCGRKLKNEP